MKHPSVLLLAMWLWILGSQSGVPMAAAGPPQEGWRLYTNARFGFSLRYPAEWRLGDPMPDGIGITLYPPVGGSQVAFSGFMNLMQGSSQDGRQTLQEFAAAHRRIITELYEKKHQTLTWEKDQESTLAGFPATRLAFTYLSENGLAVREMHIFSLGRNEGRGVRIKVPPASHKELLQIIDRVVGSFEPGRDQNAVSPLMPR
jgi:hypothetical protein